MGGRGTASNELRTTAADLRRLGLRAQPRCTALPRSRFTKDGRRRAFGDRDVHRDRRGLRDDRIDVEHRRIRVTMRRIRCAAVPLGRVLRVVMSMRSAVVRMAAGVWRGSMAERGARLVTRAMDPVVEDRVDERPEHERIPEDIQSEYAHDLSAECEAIHPAETFPHPRTRRQRGAARGAQGVLFRSLPARRLFEMRGSEVAVTTCGGPLATASAPRAPPPT